MLQIFATILGILIVAACIMDAYVKKFKHRSLIPTLLVAVSAVALTTIAIIHPSWWMIAILSYILFVFWFNTACEAGEIDKKLTSRQRKGLNFRKVDTITSFSTIIIVPIVCIIMLISHWSIWVGLVFIPLAAISSILLVMSLQLILSDIKKKINPAKH